MINTVAAAKFLSLLADKPMRNRELLDAAGVTDWRAGEDVVYELVQQGRIRIAADSQLHLIGKHEGPRGFTPAEMREKFLGKMRAYRDYWEAIPGRTTHDRLDGLCFSFLNILDGTSCGIPPFTLVPEIPEDDPHYLESQGENWWMSVPINEGVYLHDEWGKK
jgi:hypothetical protein